MATTTRQPTTYRAVWRWHFYAGLLCAPVLLLLSLTGAIYLFDREIDGWWNRDLQRVAVGAVALPLATQEAALVAAYPGASIGRVRLPDAPDEGARWFLRDAEGRGRLVFVDPYSARVLGDVDPAWQPTTIARDLHGNLLMGSIGSHLVELTACWTLVMLVTGVVLWWPKRWKARGVLWPRLRTGGRRLWRDLHAIPSAVNAVLVAFLILSGLPWSAFWGVQFAALGQQLPFIAPSPNFTASRPAAPSAGPGAASLAPVGHGGHPASHDAEAARLPWVVRQSPRPAGTGAHDDAHGHHGAGGIAAAEALLARLPVDRFGPGIRIFYPDGPAGVFTISYVPDKAEGQRTLYVDPARGQLIDDIGWDRYSPVARVIEWGVETHVGRQYGLANQIAGLLVCLVLIGTVIAGLILWWRRRPSAQLGAPSLAPTDRLPRPLVWTIAVLAVLLPLVGASLLLVWLLDRLVLALAPRLGGWLGRGSHEPIVRPGGRH